jgi:hypothetical protein
MPRIRTYGLDIDTIRFAQRVKQGSGTTILPEPLKQINKFVVGIKKLGLWNSMICWPMRSIHNAGTGSTVYSLGGRGTFNGTIVNSISWSNEGVQKINSAQRININGTDNVLRNSRSIFLVFRSTTIADNQRPFTCQDGSATGNYWQINVNTNTETNTRTFYTRNSLNYSPTTNSIAGRTAAINYIGAVIGDTTHQSFLNGSFGSLLTGLATRNPTGTPIVEILGTFGAPSSLGFVAYAIVFTNMLTREQMTILYNLYKTTLGLGLNLP